MLKTIVKTAQLELHDTNSNHVWRFEIDYLEPSIVVSKNGVRKATVGHVEYPITDEFLMSLTEGV
ncbi:hypothetical protein [Sideroxydans lithotrophicus]|uniref:Uncharacterized protein n=1 Tax=Sideroxydans lithotrophicus (strain ES-1) TaxID=580332 RepID=D5CUB7_SIDLE|nr:hypothetical protein [Sideroxydans lithotrophicus]ADE10452.1 hypothetical protein Slit_0210 [Sideroxydans lithotrophicus ES-1]